MSYYNKFTNANINKNNNERIDWKSFLGASLDSRIKELHAEGFDETQTFLKIARVVTNLSEIRYGRLRTDWKDLLKSNIGSTYSRLNSEKYCIRCKEEIKNGKN
ncbi:MAG: hypothetical protein VW262_05840 [Flavobacteriaceae bacterium]